MPSIAETVRWTADLSAADAIPGLAWSALDVVVEVAIADRRGDEVARLRLEGDGPAVSDAGIELAHDHDHIVAVAIPPRTLPPGRYEIQARVRRDGVWTAIQETPDRLYLRDAVV